MTDAINKIAVENSINNRTDSKYLDRSSIAKASKSVPYYTYSFDNETNKTSIPVYAKQKSNNNALAAFMNRLMFGSKPIKLLKIKELPLEEPVNSAEEIQRHANEIIFRNEYSTIGPNGPLTQQQSKDRSLRQITDNQNTQQRARDIDENKINIKTFIKNNCYKTIFNNIMEQDAFSGGGGVGAPVTKDYDDKNHTNWLQKVKYLEDLEKSDTKYKVPAKEPIDDPYLTTGIPNDNYWRPGVEQDADGSSEGTDPRANLVDIGKKITSDDFPPDFPPDLMDKELLKFSDDATGVSFKKGKKGSFGFNSKGRWGYIPSTPDTWETPGSRSIDTTPIPFRATDK